jgi:hypothetical protein
MVAGLLGMRKAVSRVIASCEKKGLIGSGQLAEWAGFGWQKLQTAITKTRLGDITSAGFGSVEFGRNDVIHITCPALPNLYVIMRRDLQISDEKA